MSVVRSVFHVIQSVPAICDFRSMLPLYAIGQADCNMRIRLGYGRAEIQSNPRTSARQRLRFSVEKIIEMENGSRHSCLLSHRFVILHLPNALFTFPTLLLATLSPNPVPSPPPPPSPSTILSTFILSLKLPSLLLLPTFPPPTPPPSTFPFPSSAYDDLGGHSPSSFHPCTRLPTTCARLMGTLGASDCKMTLL